MCDIYVSVYVVQYIEYGNTAKAEGSPRVQNKVIVNRKHGHS